MQQDMLERNKSMQLRLVLSLIVLALFASSIATAQTATTGEIVGVVTDPSGAVINGAAVKLDSQAGLHREATTAEDGGYLFNLLPPGHYTLLVASPGFQNASLRCGKSRYATVTPWPSSQHQTSDELLVRARRLAWSVRVLDGSVRVRSNDLLFRGARPQHDVHVRRACETQRLSHVSLS